MTTILVIDDEPKTRQNIRLYVENEGFTCLLAEDGESGLRLARDAEPSLIILDLMLPRLDGLTLCRALRRESAVPIVMVTARSHEEDKLRGLQDGADDYLTKPFSHRELMARVRAVLRRSGGEPVVRERAFRGGRIRIDAAPQRVFIDGGEVHLTPSEFRLLDLLVQSPRVWRRDELVERVRGHDADTSDRTIDAHVRNVRRKLELRGERPLIATVFGRGYRIDP